MLGYVILAHFLLLIQAKVFVVEPPQGLRVIEFLDPLPSHYLIAAQLQNNGYAVINFETTKSRPQKLHVELRVYNSNSNIFQECFLNLTTRSNAIRSGVSSLIKLSRKNVVFAWYDEMTGSIDRRTRVVAMDITDCQPIDLGINNLSNKVVVIPAIDNNDNNFDVIVSDEVICRDVGYQCRIGYDLKFRSFDINAFFINVDWFKLHMNRLYDEIFLVHGFEEDTYTVMLIDSSSGERKKLMSLFKASSRLKLISSNLSFCWVEDPDEVAAVHCSKFNLDGELIFSRTIVFDDAITLVDMQNFGDDDIFIITGKASCENQFDCWNLKSTRVTRDQTYIERWSLHFHCTDNRNRLAISYSIDRQHSDSIISAQYACRYGNGYSFEHILIDS